MLFSYSGLPKLTYFMKQNLNGNPEIQNFAQIQYQASSED